MIAMAGGNDSSSAIVYWFRTMMYFVPKNAVFVFAGAMTAPRYRLNTALLLAAIAIGVALIVHVLGQQSVGVVNYIHFAAESAGVVGGVIGVVAVSRSWPSIVRRL